MNFQELEDDLESISKKLKKIHKFIEDFNDQEDRYEDEDSFISFAKQIKISPSQYSELTPFVPYDYQNRVVYHLENSNKLIINSSRQIGLTTILFIHSLYEAIKNPNYTILWASNSYNNTTNVFMQQQYLNSEYIMKPVKSYDKSKIEFNNGSIIAVVSLAENIHRTPLPCSTIDRLIIDNAAYISHRHFDDFWNYHNLSRIDKMVLASIPNDNKGKFYEIWKYGIEWHKMMLPWYENPNRNDAWLKIMRSRWSEENFRRDFLCEFIWEQNLWRPIETAPKNGEYVLVSCDSESLGMNGNKVVIACYKNGLWVPMFTNGCFVGAEYWMPLPNIKSD